MSGTLLCPRCQVNHFTPYGVPQTDEDAQRPALSRVSDIYICSLCGHHEALQDFIEGAPTPVEEWPLPVEV